MSEKLKDAIKTIKNPAPSVTLVSHGWVKRCRMCEKHSHARWHNLAQEHLNPVALLEWIDAVEAVHPHAVAVKARIAGYVAGMTGIDRDAMKRALEAERTVAAVDPHGDSNTGTPSTRD